MSIPPPGYETPQASPPPPAPQAAPPDRQSANAHNGSRPADDQVRYVFMSVKALRGREGSARAKWQNQGWEFVSEDRGTLRTELSFRRVKPKTLGVSLVSLVATLRRLQPTTQLTLVASCALLLVAGCIGVVIGTRSPSALQTTGSTAPPAEPTVTATPEAPEPVAAVSSEPTGGQASEPQSGATLEPEAEDGDAASFENCDEVRAAGLDPLERGDGIYEQNTHLDRDGDGLACE